jgi:hypothetical protein
MVGQAEALKFIENDSTRRTGEICGPIANRPKSAPRRNFAITIALASLCNCKKC